MTNIAVVDDQDLLRDSLSQTLSRVGYKVSSFPDAGSAIETIQKQSFDLVISDLKMPGIDGVQMLRQIRQLGHDVPVIMMTAYGTVSSAVEAMKLGAFDYIQKPFDSDEIELLVKRAMQDRHLRTQNEALHRTVNDLVKNREFVGQSLIIRKVRDQIAKIAPSNSTVLIEGESGTGKEMIARSIHWASDRASQPMLCLNCAAISAGLLESELFGHEKGAFTGADKLRKGRFELADGGTLLLDEISEIPMTLQAKLLRVLQEKQFERVGSCLTRDVNVRIIATTNRNLWQWVKQGQFREDLYYRLSVLPIYIPALHDRREDIGLLAQYFLDQSARKSGREPAKLDPVTIRLLESYAWPGNVRELENLLERAWVLSGGEKISPDLIEPWLQNSRPDEAFSARPGCLLEDMEREMILKTLNQFNGHRAKTAKTLGIGLRTLGLKLKRWQEQGNSLLAS
ncbi:MAG: sigma-54 dependent transcriptional regulator [Phycisphaerae bacterium]